MRKSRLIHVLLAALLTMTLGVPSAGAENEVAFTDETARSWVLMEQETGTMLCGENIHEKLEPASVTKVMTMLLVVEALDNGQLTTEQVVTVSDYAASMGGSQGLRSLQGESSMRILNRRMRCCRLLRLILPTDIRRKIGLFMMREETSLPFTEQAKDG